MFKENMVFKIEKEKYRIVGMNEKTKEIFIIRLDKRDSWNEIIGSQNLEELFRTKKAVLDNEAIVVEIEENLSEKAMKKQQLYSEIIAEIFKGNNIDIYSHNRKFVIDEVKRKFNISESTIRRVISRYLKNGKVFGGIIKYKNCGKSNQGVKSYKNKDIVSVNPEFQEVFRRGIDKYYNNKINRNIKVTYELIIRDYIKKNPQKKVPSFKQFYYWFRKIIQEDEGQKSITKRRGERIYQQIGTPIVGSSIDDGVSPADLYQIDSTILDVYIVSELNRNLIVGRPILYLVIDTYSRLIVGMNVTVEPFNSYAGVSGALINTFINKKEYCKGFGVEIKEDEWDVQCIPNRILADRGELLGKNIENAIINLGVMIQNTPPYRGDMKGIVEKSFERIHALIKPFVSGVVDNKFNRIERGKEDYRLKANLTLKEITNIIIRCVLYNNNKHILKFYNGDGLDIKKEVALIPKEIWKYGIEYKAGMLRELSEEVVRLNLLPSKEATVTAKGVRFNKLFYISKEALEEKWFNKARIEGCYKIRVSYDRDDISKIYYLREDSQVLKLELVKHLNYYKNISESEFELIENERKKLSREAEKVDEDAKRELYENIEEISKEAKRRQEKVKEKGISKSKRLKDIRQNLESEREYYRKNKNEKKDEEVQELEIFDIDWGVDYE